MPPAPRAPSRSQRRWYSSALPSMANLQAQYNFHSISMAMLIMKDAFPRSGWETYLLPCIAFVGGIHGLMVFGHVADWVGRPIALSYANLLCAVFSVASALCPVGYPSLVYLIIAVCRYFIGVGVGGVIPLSVIIAAEHGNTIHIAKRHRRICWAYLWTIPGTALPFLVGAVAMRMFPDSPDVQFRLVLGLGGVPATLSLALSLLAVQREPLETIRDALNTMDLNLVKAIRQPEYWRDLTGTALASLCHAVTRYGPALMAPQIVSALFADAHDGGEGRGEEEVYSDGWRAAVWVVWGMPALALATLLVRVMGPRTLQIVGFLAVSASTFALAQAFAAGEHVISLFTIFCAVTFTLNLGPAVTTLILPCDIFPCEVRATFTGLSEGFGLLGAAIITALNPLITDSHAQITRNLYVYSFTGLMGAFVTLLLIERPTRGQRTLRFRFIEGSRRGIPVGDTSSEGTASVGDVKAAHDEMSKFVEFI